jgi:multidrug transporter EmrE-like cation transporter
MGTLFLVLSILFNSVANALFKLAGEIQDFSTRKVTFLGLGLLVGLANTLCYLKALEKIDLGIAFPLFAAASILVISLISLFYFHEQLSVQKWIGMAVICVGLAIMWKS